MRIFNILKLFRVLSWHLWSTKKAKFLFHRCPRILFYWRFVVYKNLTTIWKIVRASRSCWEEILSFDFSDSIFHFELKETMIRMFGWPKKSNFQVYWWKLWRILSVEVLVRFQDDAKKTLRVSYSDVGEKPFVFPFYEFPVLACWVKVLFFQPRTPCNLDFRFCCTGVWCSIFI